MDVQVPVAVKPPVVLYVIICDIDGIRTETRKQMLPSNQSAGLLMNHEALEC